MKPIVAFFLVLTSITGKTTAQTNNALADSIGSIHESIEKALINKSLDKFLSYYEPDAICMPEYHTALYSRKDISAYYQSWFDSAAIISLDKKIVDLQEHNGYIIEVGTFIQQHKHGSNNTIEYTGKYLTVWKRRDGKYKIVSEIWGANTPINPKMFSFTDHNSSSAIPQPASTPVAKEVAERNKRITELVTKREGVQHATEFFLPDAIYLTYDSPMFIGFDNIKNYFAEHEKPGDVIVNTLEIKASRIIDLGTIVIEYGYYTIDVSWKGGGGTFKGKSTNIWKRNKNNQLMLYRQMVNHT